MNLEVGKTYKFECEGETLEGTLERVVKMKAPCVPSEDPNDWTLHINVTSEDPRIGGTYCRGIKNLIGA
jgi:hypothetical protein